CHELDRRRMNGGGFRDRRRGRKRLVRVCAFLDGCIRRGGAGRNLRPRSRELDMDVIERHFAAENAHDVRATLDTYTDDVIWDDVGNPGCPVYGKAATSGMYEGIMAAIPDLHIRSVLRFGDAEHVVDEAVASGHVEGSFLGVEGGGAPVSFRML